MATSANPSYIQGRNSIINVNITAGVNDKLSLTVDGSVYDMTITAGSYDLNGLVGEIQLRLNDAGINDKVEATQSGNSLMLRSKIPDATVQLQSVTGTAVKDLFKKVDTYTNYADTRAPNTTDTCTDGRMDLTECVEISAGINNILEFDVHNYDTNNTERVSIVLDQGEYSADGFAAMLNDKLSAAGYKVSAELKNVNTPQGMKEIMSLKYSPGVNGSFGIDGVGGTAAYTVFYPGPFDIKYSGGRELTLQVGANAGDNFDLGLDILMNLETLGIKNIDLSTRDGAEFAIDKIDKAMVAVSGQRGIIGSKRNALESLYKTVSVTAENTTAAESRIRDADVAREMMEYAKASVLMQASIAMLAQANQQPQQVLHMLTS